MFGPSKENKAQIALEFLIVYSFVLVIFILVFSIVTSQRASSLGQQQYSLLQLQAQNIASYVNQGLSAGSGYSVTVPLVSSLAVRYYNISISSTGVIIASSKVGSQPVTAYAFSGARNLVINGTQIENANGIVIYQLQIANGGITITNSKGIIYIDEQPASVASLAQGAVITQSSNAKAATFSDSPTRQAYITISNNVVPLALGTSFTMSFWLKSNPQRQSCGSLIGMPGSSQLLIYEGPALACFIPGYYPLNNYLSFKYVDNLGTTHSGLNSGNIISGTWTYATATFNSTSGSMIWYINGVKTSTYTSLPAIGIDSSPLYIGSGDKPFNGSIANLQIYNSVLSANQVRIIYNNGLSGGLVNSSAIGWWPLNGNPNDYSGGGSQGAPSNNLQYNSVVQITARVFSTSNSISNDLVGFVGSIGSLSANGTSGIAYTNGNGLVSGFLTSNGASGPANVLVDVFNGNISTEASMVGWWPLDTGYGSIAYDLSGGYDNGAFNAFGWGQTTNRTNLIAASFPGNPAGVTSSATQDGFITVKSSQSLLGIVPNESLTVTGWIYYKGPTSLHSQGIFGNLAGGNGFQLIGYCNGCSSGAVLYIGGSSIPFPNGYNSFPQNRWEMVTAEYNGTTGLASVYLNKTAFATGRLPFNLPLLQTSSYFIGDDASQPTGLDTFNGSIANLQMYNNYLTPSQIATLYGQGISSTPISDSGLISWWPLSNNTHDYTFNNNTGSVNYNVIFTNVNYNSSASSRTLGGVASFNGFSNIIIPYTPRLASAAGNFSVNFWFLSYLPSSANFDSELLDMRQPLDNTYDVQLCGSGASCGGIAGIKGLVGNGVSLLNGAVDYQFNFKANTWYSVTETFNRTNWTIYLNGNKASSGAYAGVPQLVNINNYIEIGGGSGTSSFKGQIANLQIYNASLTSSEAMQLYEQGFPLQQRLNVSVG